MDTTLLIAIVGFSVELIAMVAAAVWVVGKINAATQNLGVTIEHLRQSLDRLRSWTESLETKVDDHGERIAVVETKVDAR